MLLEFVLGLLGEFLFNLAFGAVLEFGWQTLHNSFRPARYADKWLASLGLLALGLIAGLLSALLVSSRLLPTVGFSGLSLVTAPVLAGAGLELFGRLIQRNGMEHTPLMTWWGGALFAFGMASGRLILLGG